MMRTLLISVAALALAGNANAQNPPGMTEQACQQARQELGERAFAQLFGSMPGCIAKLGALIESASGDCAAKGLGRDTPEFNACVQDAVRAALKQSAPTEAGSNGAEQARKSCVQVKEKLGVAKFKQRYRSIEACVAEITKLMTVCAKEAKPGSAEFGKCLEQRSKSGGNDTGATAAEQARKSCVQVKEKLGAAKFKQRYRSIEACIAEVTKLMSVCAKEAKPGSAEFKQCLERRLPRP